MFKDQSIKMERINAIERMINAGFVHRVEKKEYVKDVFCYKKFIKRIRNFHL